MKRFVIVGKGKTIMQQLNHWAMHYGDLKISELDKKIPTFGARGEQDKQTALTTR